MLKCFRKITKKKAKRSFMLEIIYIMWYKLFPPYVDNFFWVCYLLGDGYKI